MIRNLVVVLVVITSVAVGAFAGPGGPREMAREVSKASEGKISEEKALEAVERELERQGVSAEARERIGIEEVRAKIARSESFYDRLGENGVAVRRVMMNRGVGVARMTEAMKNETTETDGRGMSPKAEKVPSVDEISTVAATSAKLTVGDVDDMISVGEQSEKILGENLLDIGMRDGCQDKPVPSVAAGGDGASLSIEALKMGIKIGKDAMAKVVARGETIQEALPEAYFEDLGKLKGMTLQESKAAVVQLAKKCRIYNRSVLALAGN